MMNVPNADMFNRVSLSTPRQQVPPNPDSAGVSPAVREMSSGQRARSMIDNFAADDFRKLSLLIGP
jgi:hypothetical protein